MSRQFKDLKNDWDMMRWKNEIRQALDDAVREKQAGDMVRGVLPPSLRDVSHKIWCNRDTADGENRIAQACLSVMNELPADDDFVDHWEYLLDCLDFAKNNENKPILYAAMGMQHDALPPEAKEIRALLRDIVRDGFVNGDVSRKAFQTWTKGENLEHRDFVERFFMAPF